MPRDRQRLESVINDRENTWRMVPSNSAGMLVLALANIYRYDRAALTACLADIRSFATDDDKRSLVDFIEHKANEPYDPLDWVTLYQTYDLILMSAQPGTKIDLDNLQAITFKNYQMPILIKQDGHFYLYRRFAKCWVKMELDKTPFEQLTFPDFGETLILKNEAISSAAHQEIVNKEGKPYYKGEPKYLDVPTLLPLKQVLPLVWQALKDHPRYAHAQKGETPELRLQQAGALFGDRLANFFSVLFRVQMGICHHGVRNELIFLLNGNYSLDNKNSVVLIADAELFVIGWIRDTIGEAYANAYKNANDVTKKQFEKTILSWMKEVKPQVMLSLVGNEDSIRNKLVILFLSHGLNPEDTLIKTPIDNMFLDLSFAYSQEYYPPSLEAVNNLFNAVENGDTVYEKGLKKITTWIDAEFESANKVHEKRVIEIDNVYQVYKRILKYKPYLSMTAENLMQSVLIKSHAYFDDLADGRFPELTDEFREEISQLNKIIDHFLKDNLQSHIENFFKHWFDSEDNRDTDTLRRYCNLLLDDKVQSKLTLDDHCALLQSFKDIDAGILLNFEISPYQINQIFLHAIVNSPEHWSPLFAKAFQLTLAYIKHKIIQPDENFGNDRLIRESYVEKLIEQLDYLQYLYREFSRADDAPPVTVVPRSMSICLPRQTTNICEVANILRLYNTMAGLAIYRRFKKEFDLAISKDIKFFNYRIHSSSLTLFQQFSEYYPIIFIEYIRTNFTKLIKQINDYRQVIEFLHTAYSLAKLPIQEFFDLKLEILDRCATLGMDVNALFSRDDGNSSIGVIIPSTVVTLAHTVDAFAEEKYKEHPAYFIKLITLLAKHRANFNKLDGLGRTPLHHLVMSPNLNADHKIKVIQIFANNGADFLIRDHEDKRPIDHTTGSVYLAIKEIMLEKIPKPAAVKSFEDILLVLEFLSNEEKLNVYLTHKSIFDKYIPQNYDAISKLPAVVAKAFFYRYCSDITRCFQAILEQLRELEIRCGTKSIDSKYMCDVFLKCVERGMNPNGMVSRYTSLIQFAASSGHVALVQSLHQQNVNINKVDDQGNTPSHLAARNGHLAVLELLRSVGANVRIKNADGKTADQLFIEKMTQEMDIGRRHAVVIISLVTRENNPFTASQAKQAVRNLDMEQTIRIANGTSRESLLADLASQWLATHHPQLTIIGNTELVDWIVTGDGRHDIKNYEDYRNLTLLLNLKGHRTNPPFSGAEFEAVVNYQSTVSVSLDNHSGLFCSTSSTSSTVSAVNNKSIVELADLFDYWMKHHLEYHLVRRHSNNTHQALLDFLSQIHCADYIRNYPQFCQLTALVRARGYVTDLPTDKLKFFDCLEEPANDQNLGYLLAIMPIGKWPNQASLRSKIASSNHLFATLALVSMNKGLYLLDQLGAEYLESILLSNKSIQDTLKEIETYHHKNTYTLCLIAILRAYKSQRAKDKRSYPSLANRLFVGVHRQTILDACSSLERIILSSRFDFSAITAKYFGDVEVAMFKGELGQIRNAFRLHGKTEYENKKTELPDQTVALCISDYSHGIYSKVRIQQKNGDFIQDITPRLTPHFVLALPNGDLLIMDTLGTVDVINPKLKHSADPIPNLPLKTNDTRIHHVVVLNQDRIAIICNSYFLTIYQLKNRRFTTEASIALPKEMSLEGDVVVLKNGRIVISPFRAPGGYQMSVPAPLLILDSNGKTVLNKRGLRGQIIELPNERIALLDIYTFTIYDIGTDTIIKTFEIPPLMNYFTSKRFVTALPIGLIAIWTKGYTFDLTIDPSHTILIYDPISGNRLADFTDHQTVHSAFELRELMRELKPEYFVATVATVMPANAGMTVA